MSQDLHNPYASPQAVGEPPPGNSQDRRLYEIAKAQRFLVAIVGLGFLANLLYAGGMGLENAMLDKGLKLLVFLFVFGLQIAVSILQSVAMYRMGKTVHNQLNAIGLAIFSFIPCIGLIVMLVVNNNATNRLQAGGIQVGFLGADLNQFDPTIRNA